MIKDVYKEEEKIRKIWLEHINTIPLKRIFDNYLGIYFDVSIPHIPTKKQVNKDWLFFLNWDRKWKKEERKKQIERDLENMDDEAIEEMQDKNRKRMILLLKRMLDTHEFESKSGKLLNVGEIRRMYKALQSLEEVKKRTEISRGKLKLEAVKTLLPYQRMPLPELLALKEKLNESFDRIIKLKSGESVGSDSPISG